MRALFVVVSILATLLLACSDDSSGDKDQGARDLPASLEAGNPAEGGTTDRGPKTDQPVITGSKTCQIHCTQKDECAGIPPFIDCVNGKCVTCTTDADCAYGIKKCDTASGTCKSCDKDADCTTGTKKCSPGFTCYGCSGDADCAKETKLKKCVQGVCNLCTSDADCAKETFTGCNTQTGSCSKCKKDSECCTYTPCNLTCDEATGSCICGSDQGCTEQYPPIPGVGSLPWKCM